MPARSTWTSAAILLAAMFLPGCDNQQNQADKQVQQELAQARLLLLSAKPGDADQAYQKLQEAAANAAASDDVRAAAKAALAQAELDMAQSFMRQLERAEMDLARVVWEISQLAEQIRTCGSIVSGYLKYDPQPARQNVADRIAQVQGGPGKPEWIRHDNAVIPTLSAVRQEISRLEGQIASTQEQIRTLSEQRSRLLEQAEQAAAQAERLKGDQALEVFKRSSDLRRQAGDLAVEIDKLQSQARRLQNDLAIAQGQQAVLNEVIEQLEHQAATQQTAWKHVDQQIAAQRALAWQILGAGESTGGASGPAASGTIVQKSAEMSRLAGQVQQLRSQALLNASNAARLFEEAYRAADQFRISMERQISDPRNIGRPEADAWKRMVASLNPAQFRLQQAAAQRAVGDLHASAAASLGRRIALRQLLKLALAELNLPMPAEIADDTLDQARTQALEQAGSAYRDSDELLTNVAEGQTSEQLQATAMISRALTLYAWAQLDRQAGDQTQASEKIQQAIQQRNLAAERNFPLPALPAELGQASKPPVQIEQQ